MTIDTITEVWVDDKSKVAEFKKVLRFVAIACAFEILPEPVLLFPQAVVQPQVSMGTVMGLTCVTWKPMSLQFLLAGISAHSLPLKKEG